MQRKVIDKRVLLQHLQSDHRSYVSKTTLEFLATIYGYWMEVPNEEVEVDLIEEKDEAAAPIEENQNAE